MRSYLFPAFTMESEDFERALPMALKFSKSHNIPCRVLKEGDLYAICFRDKAIARGIVYGHLHEKELDKNFGKYAIADTVYLREEDFERGLCCDQQE
ncbi:hypothetical protein [Desulforamulus ruminis]|uniref:Uncharacterized protein n=1 Tax=Desulforamulus ruminis (strain ATCC 23193 / DSM 2154 / NCIMB 8452 / DL) TaxID=696281 RepID=F6DKY9_DESRL|nr:hypothetical protein [Desulforamulus ruminis]AEG61621.1 hypothetical protein Desru_3418 [Desulforamulus ruminis DSM 2154]